MIKQQRIQKVKVPLEKILNIYGSLLITVKHKGCLAKPGQII